MEHTFVWFNDHWRLLIDSYDKLVDYHTQVNGKWANAVIDAAVMTDGVDHRKSTLSQLVRVYAENHEQSVVVAADTIARRVFNAQMDAIDKQGGVLLNDRGGYCFPLESYPMVTHKEGITFPHHTKADIRIKKWDIDGGHYYAYVGEVEVKDGDQIKWNTHDAAYSAALKYVEV